MIDIFRHRGRRHGRLSNIGPRRRRLVRPWNWDRLEERTLLNAADLDPTFGTGGHVTTDFPLPGEESLATSVVIDSKGRAIVAGVVADAQNNNRVVVVRYEPNGQLDTSLATGGRSLPPSISSTPALRFSRHISTFPRSG